MAVTHVNNNVLANHYKVEVVADEKAPKMRPDFIGINLRPSTLTSKPANKIELGKTKLLSRGLAHLLQCQRCPG
jgi:hypothetical protein